MSDQILTQEEIDALLSAMDSGEVDLAEEAKSVAEVVDYNLTSRNIMLRDQFYALEEVYDKFATLFEAHLSSVLQRSMEVEFVSTEMVKYQECISAFSSPTSFTVYTMAPLIGSAMLAIEPRLIYSLIDCMFGGDGKPTERMREFTLIEQRMIRKFATQVLTNLQLAWKTIDPINIAIKRAEIKPEFVHLASPSDLMVVIVFAVKGKEFSGNLHLVIPYLMLEPIKDKLSSRYLRAKDSEAAFSDRIQKTLEETNVNLIAELGYTSHTFGDLIALQIDDIFTLNTGPHDPITVKIESEPKYRGYPGIINGNRAVEIVDIISPEEAAAE